MFQYGGIFGNGGIVGKSDRPRKAVLLRHRNRGDGHVMPLADCDFQ
jgi:hypothetical protein